MLQYSLLLVALSLFLYINLSLQSIDTVHYYNPAHPGKCFINNDLILSPGESAQDPDECGLIECIGGEKGVAEIESCPSYDPPSMCQFGESVDKTANHPQCCVLSVLCEDPESLVRALEYQENMRIKFEPSSNS